MGKTLGPLLGPKKYEFLVNPLFVKIHPEEIQGQIFFSMDGNGETTNFHVKIWNHPIERTIF